MGESLLARGFGAKEMIELLLALMLAVVAIPIAMLCGGLWLGMKNRPNLRRNSWQKPRT